jgi:8-oxo-dGTP pyrophosphatase MutT (NUDIX family)
MPKETRSAGGIVLGEHGTIAMVQNRRGTQWLFPKGHVEPGETDEQAARREILEETGIGDLDYIDDLGSYKRYRLDKEGGDDLSEMKEIHMYLFSAPSSTTLSPTMEIEAAKWVPLQNVAQEIGSTKDRAWFISVFERVRLAVQRD